MNAAQEVKRHPVNQEVRNWLDDADLTLIGVAANAGIDYKRFHSMMARRMARPQVDVLLAVETAYGLTPGFFLRRAGYVAPADSFEAMIDDDKRLSEEWRQSFRKMLQVALNDSSGLR